MRIGLGLKLTNKRGRRLTIGDLAGFAGAWFATDAVTSSGNVTSLPGRYGAATMTPAGAGTPFTKDATGLVHAGGFPTDAQYFPFPSQLVFTGEMTLYFVYNNSSGLIVPFAKADGTDQIYVNGTVLTQKVGGSIFNNWTIPGTGLVLVRVRRTASNQMFAAATGVAELELGGNSGTYTFNRMLADVFGSYMLACKFVGLVPFSKDTVTAGTDTAILATINTVTGATL